MKKINYISKQFELRSRDYLNSIYYGIAVPVLFGIQDLIANDGFSLSKDTLFEKVAMIVISAVLAHIIRKATEKSKEVTISPVESGTIVYNSAESEPIPNIDEDGDKDPDKTLPPPLGDPTHPKR